MLVATKSSPERDTHDNPQTTRPIQEQGVYHVPSKKTWWDKIDTNGDVGLMIIQFALAPIVLPYMWIKRLFR